MDDRVIKAALDHFENDEFLQAKELVQGQVRQAKNDFIKGKLGLKNDIEQQFTNVEAGTNITDVIEPAEKSFSREEIPDETEDETPKPKKKLLTRKKK
jgi:SOS response regulatory protein OraA/RecX